MYKIQSVTGDGNCLFRSVSLYKYGTQGNQRAVRLEAVNYIRRHWKELKDHLVLTDPSLRGERNYCYNMRQDKTYGTSVEILAMSELYELNFNVHTVDKKPENNQFSTDKIPTIISKVFYNNNINLLMIGNLENGHFELLQQTEILRTTEG